MIIVNVGYLKYTSLMFTVLSSAFAILDGLVRLDITISSVTKVHSS